MTALFPMVFLQHTVQQVGGGVGQCFITTSDVQNRISAGSLVLKFSLSSL